MDNIAYIMASKQQSAVRNLEVISNNVANLNTAGFKSDHVLFTQYLHQDKHDKTSMTGIQGSMIDLQEGSLKTTSAPLDMAISGRGMFIIRTPAGDRFTRNGHFTINAEGTLVNAKGYPVLSLDRQEIVFEDGDDEPIIGSDGTIYIGSAIRGQVGMAEFEDLTSLKKLGNGLFIATSDPKEPEESRLVQGALESSNVNSIAQIALLAQIEKEVAQTTTFISDNYALQSKGFKVYGKL